jgi:tetratricopeptide (TPR) repeat protein
MELGRMTEAEAELQIVAEEAAALKQPAQLWGSTAGRANLALFQGRFDEAQTLIEDAATLGERAQSRDSAFSYRLQRFVFDRERGGDPEIESLIRGAVCEFPTRPVFRCALADIYARAGDASRAQAAIDDLGAQDFAAIQRDNEYLFSFSFLADAAETLGDLRAAAVLYDLLAPYRDLNAINTDEIATGSVSRPLAVLAAAMSRWGDAVSHFELAADHNERMGARPWLAHTQHDFARMLLARDAPPDRARARQLLISATGQYEMLGMTPWLARASELLVATGRAAPLSRQ